MTERADGQVTWSDLGLWSGKTCPEHSAATKGETSRQSSKRSSASQSRKPPILKCLKRDGQLGGGYHDEVGGRWSVAWRVHDAQYWGVPQRRRRISVIADFGGDTAGEILFERKSVSRHPAESGTAGERLAGNAENGASYAVRIRGAVTEEGINRR